MKPKSLFKRVFDFARSEIERRAKLGADGAQGFESERTHQGLRPAEAFSARTSSHREPPGHADMGHADMGHADMGHADLGHADMGHADMAHADMAPAPSAHASPEAVASVVQADSTEIATEQKGLEVVRVSHAGLKLAWSLSASDIERARALTEAEAVLCLRVVAFSPLRDDVRREVQDRPGVAREGRCDLDHVDSRAVVAIGVRAGEHFVSIHHQTV